MLDDARRRRLRPCGREIIALRTFERRSGQAARAARGHHQRQALDPLRRAAPPGAARSCRPSTRRRRGAAAMPSASSTPTLSSRHVGERVRALDAQAERVAQRVEREVGHAGGGRSSGSGRCRGCRSGSRESRARRAARRSPRASRASCMPRPMIEQQRLALRRAVVFDLERDAVGGDLHQWRRRRGIIGAPAPSRRARRCGRTSAARRTASNGFQLLPIGCASRSATA